MTRPRTLRLVIILVFILLPFTISPVRAQATTLTYGQGVVGKIDGDDTLLIYSFEGMEGDLVTVQVVALTDNLEPTLSINSPSQEQIENSDDDPFSPGEQDARVDTRLTEAGTYTLLISGETGTKGNFLLRIDGGPTPEPVELTADAPSLQIAVTVEAPTHALSFSADPENLLRLFIISDFAFTGSLRHSDGRLLAQVDSADLRGVGYLIQPGSQSYELIFSGDEDQTGVVIADLTSAEERPGVVSSGAEACMVAAGPGGTPVRSAPGVRQSVLGELEANSEAEVVAVGGGPARGWVMINFEGMNGWVNARIAAVSGVCDALPVISSEADLPGDN